jgi:hypothetical protein
MTEYARVQRVAVKLGRKPEGLIGLMFLPRIIAGLRLNLDQIELFCDKTPCGEALWIAFKKRRDASSNQDYNLEHYVLEIVNGSSSGGSDRRGV